MSKLATLQVKIVSFTTLLVLQDQGLWGFAVPLSKTFVEFPIKSANLTMALGYFQINGVNILVFRKPLTSRGKLPFSQNLSQVAGRQETMKSLILLNMCYNSPFCIKIWMLPLNSGFLLVRKRRKSPFY